MSARSHHLDYPAFGDVRPALSGRVRHALPVLAGLVTFVAALALIVRRPVKISLTMEESAAVPLVALAAWQALLMRLSGQHDLVVGIPVFGRQAF